MEDTTFYQFWHHFLWFFAISLELQDLEAQFVKTPDDVPESICIDFESLWNTLSSVFTS